MAVFAVTVTLLLPVVADTKTQAEEIAAKYAAFDIGRCGVDDVEAEILTPDDIGEWGLAFPYTANGLSQTYVPAHFPEAPR